MNKGQIIGLTVTVLAVVGGVAVFNYFRKPRQNRDGFFNAEGTTSTMRTLCVRRNKDGSTTSYSPINGTDCSYGGRLVRR